MPKKNKVKYFFLHLQTRDGEREYDHKSVHTTEHMGVPPDLSDDDALNKWANEYCADFWGESDDNDEYGYWFFGEIITSMQSVRFITKKEYDVLREFL